MRSLDQISVRQFYREVSNIQANGIPGYDVPKKYQDPLAIMKKRQMQSGAGAPKKKQTKRGSYLQDYAKLHKSVPGPGKYKDEDLWPKKSKSIIKPSKKVTYFQQLMNREKKQKRPAPGFYQIGKSLKQLDAQRKANASKKVKTVDRINYLDQIQYESTLVPGVGNYNPRKRVQTQMSPIKTKPEDWRKKHAEQGKKKLPKLPDMGTYNPQTVEFDLFSSIKKQGNHKKNYLGKVERFKTWSEKYNLGPGKYVKIQEWKGKQAKLNKQRYGLQAISKGVSKSVYYH